MHNQEHVWRVLNRNLFFIKDAVKGWEAKTSDKFEVCDPDLREVILECGERDLGGVTKLRRLAGGKYDRGSPFNLAATLPGSQQQVLRITLRVPFLSVKKPPIEFHDHEDRLILTMKRKFFSIGRKFQFFTPPDAPLLELNAKSIFNGYRLMANKKELGTISTRWKGNHADYFKTGFKYALSINEDVSPDSLTRQLLLGSALGFHRMQM